MWVYQQTGTPAHLPEAAQQLPTGEAALLPQPQKTLPPERSAPEVPSPLQRHNTETRQKTYWLLVCAFLIGSGSAGVLLAFCEKQQPDWLQYYLQSWRGLFAAADAHTAASLFGMEYLTLAAAATLLFLMGFSALGPVLIFLFTMFYGLGNGTLFVQLLSDTALKKGTWLLLLAFLPAAAASAGLCTLGTDSLRVSSQIRVCSFLAAGPDREIVRPHGFIRQYLLTLTLFVPLCGISAALASIGSRL